MILTTFVKRVFLFRARSLEIVHSLGVARRKGPYPWKMHYSTSYMEDNTIEEEFRPRH